MANYVRLAATAKRLIEKNGQNLTFTKNSEIPADPTKPWRGSDAAIYLQTVVKGIVTSADFADDEGTIVRHGVLRSIIAATSLPRTLSGVTVATAGSGYAVNDVITLAGGTLNNVAAKVKVTAINGMGGVTAATLISTGAYSVLPTTFTDGGVVPSGGTGATFTATDIELDMREFDRMGDNQFTYKIVASDPVKPGDVTLIWIFELKK